MAERLTAEFVAAISKAALAAMGDLVARRKWPRSHAGSPVTVSELCAEIAQLNLEREEMRTALTGASHALKSYAYGNGSPDLAKGMAAHVDAVIAKAEGR